MLKKTKNPSYPSSGSRVAILATLLAITAIFASTLSAEEVFRGPVTADGEVLVFGGRVLDRQGQAVPDTAVEIWQTDGQGIYDHSGDSDTNRRDRGFQFFGTSVSDSSGHYAFRTIIPGQYEPRPRHIHVKIRQPERVLLTSQIYFSVDGDTSGVGGSARNLMMDLETVKMPDGSTQYSGAFDFVVDTGISGNLRLTDGQGEGPYYPQNDVSLFDNDLAQMAGK